MVKAQLSYIPSHLRPYVSQQDPSLYTAVDHAGWRFVLKISRDFFRKHAHPVYLDGLEKTGISTEKIPLISEMDEKLARFGWHAVPVCGFVPPAVFMEFLSLGILPIACDMRRLEHLAYTPAPDVVHEAAGHAPIIADPGYARYLRRYGEISRKAIHSDSDWSVYLAIRNLSDVKENPASSTEEIASAQRRLDAALSTVHYVSEASQLARMSWWTIEYGLVGTRDNPKIYGAGLLSSVGESYHCLRDSVAKIPFSLDCVEQSYDITRPQPQLYLAPDFESLSEVLEKLAGTMAFRTGGTQALAKAKRAKTVTTVVLDSGAQISGRLADFLTDERGAPALLRHEGPTQLAKDDRQLKGHGPKQHPDGLVTILGAPERLAEDHWDFGNGFSVMGRRVAETQEMLVVADALVVRQGASIHRASEMHLVLGKAVPSVFGGAGDREAFLSETGGFEQPPGVPKTNLTAANRELNTLYARVRELREKGKANQAVPELARIQEELDHNYPDDWLLRYELLELDAAWNLNAPWAERVRRRLMEIGTSSQATGDMIRRGFASL